MSIEGEIMLMAQRLVVFAVAAVGLTTALALAHTPAPSTRPPQAESIALVPHHHTPEEGQSSEAAISTDRNVVLPSNRAAHIRVWDAEGALLTSTWPEEHGTFPDERPASRAGQPIAMRNAGEEGEHPLWGPLLPMLDQAPINATVRLVNYTFGDHTVGEFSLPRHTDIHKEATLPVAFAEKALGKLTPGRTVGYLAEIPILITGATNETASYRIMADASSTIPIQRSEGLQLDVVEAPSNDLIRLELRAREGSFVAHNNCAVQDKLIPQGFYVLREETESELRFDRYNSRGEYLLEHQRGTIEVRFFDDPPSMPSDSTDTGDN